MSKIEEYYHIMIITKQFGREIKLDLSKEELNDRFIGFYETGNNIFINGKQILSSDISKIKINRTKEKSSIIISRAKANNSLKSGSFVSDDLYVASQGEVITDELIKGPVGYKKSENKKKFVDCSEDIPFAIVLLSPDDKGCEANKFPESAKVRARQNVILELGYFIGKLGRNNVLVLFKEENDFELPSDILGLLFAPFDNGWEMKMVKELKSSGYNVDFNKLV